MLAMCVLWGCKNEDGTTLSLNSDSLIFPYGGGTQTLTISSNTKWGISKFPEWISVSVASGTGTAEVTLTAKANPEKTDRDGFAVVYSDDGQQTLVVGLKQLGTHSSPIILDNTEEKVFGGRESVSWSFYEDGINITCDTEWDIEGPSWITIYYGTEEVALTAKLRLEGSGYIGLATNETYTGDEARRDTIYFRTVSGESIAKVPVCQLGKNEIHCFNPVISADGFTCKLKVGSNIEKIFPVLWNPGYEPSILDSTWAWYYADSNSKLSAANNDGTYFSRFYYENPNFEMDANYTFQMLGEDAAGSLALPSNISQYTIHTLNEDELRPRVEIKDVMYVNGHWQWTVSLNEYTSLYMTQFFSYSDILSEGKQPYMMAHDMVFFYNLGIDMVNAQYGDVSKTFISKNINENGIIIAIPLGKGYKPSWRSLYDTGSYTTNTPVKGETTILNYKAK